MTDVSERYNFLLSKIVALEKSIISKERADDLNRKIFKLEKNQQTFQRKLETLIQTEDKWSIRSDDASTDGKKNIENDDRFINPSMSAPSFFGNSKLGFGLGIADERSSLRGKDSDLSTIESKLSDVSKTLVAMQRSMIDFEREKNKEIYDLYVFKSEMVDFTSDLKQIKSDMKVSQSKINELYSTKLCKSDFESYRFKFNPSDDVCKVLDQNKNIISRLELLEKWAGGGSLSNVPLSKGFSEAKGLVAQNPVNTMKAIPLGKLDDDIGDITSLESLNDYIRHCVENLSGQIFSLSTMCNEVRIKQEKITEATQKKLNRVKNDVKEIREKVNKLESSSIHTDDKLIKLTGDVSEVNETFSYLIDRSVTDYIHNEVDRVRMLLSELKGLPQTLRNLSTTFSRLQRVDESQTVSLNILESRIAELERCVAECGGVHLAQSKATPGSKLDVPTKALLNDINMIKKQIIQIDELSQGNTNELAKIQGQFSFLSTKQDKLESKQRKQNEVLQHISNRCELSDNGSINSHYSGKLEKVTESVKSQERDVCTQPETIKGILSDVELMKVKLEENRNEIGNLHRYVEDARSHTSSASQVDDEVSKLVKKMEGVENTLSKLYRSFGTFTSSPPSVEELNDKINAMEDRVVALENPEELARIEMKKRIKYLEDSVSAIGMKVSAIQRIIPDKDTLNALLVDGLGNLQCDPNDLENVRSILQGLDFPCRIDNANKKNDNRSDQCISDDVLEGINSKLRSLEQSVRDCSKFSDELFSIQVKLEMLENIANTHTKEIAFLESPQIHFANTYIEPINENISTLKEDVERLGRMQMQIESRNITQYENAKRDLNSLFKVSFAELRGRIEQLERDGEDMRRRADEISEQVVSYIERVSDVNSQVIELRRDVSDGIRRINTEEVNRARHISDLRNDIDDVQTQINIVRRLSSSSQSCTTVRSTSSIQS